MDDKNRLESIKDLWNSDNTYCDPLNYEWLIQQAENKRLNGKISELIELVLKEQNERYKQALELILETSGSIYTRKIARQALEEPHDN